ncbi:hypothetical protein K5549_009944 [Capra hircus]|uniref:Transmembrane protein 242 n=1 Tax=Capra hircus TaxID=9925 RepID=A0A452FET0_CAPHI|nr:hypothetical protein K5549_009944 [Capra hircus]
METEGTGITELSCQLEALVSTDDWLFLVKGGILLGTDAAIGMLAGFVTTLSLAKRQSPKWLNKATYSLTFRALGWGSLYAWCGVAVINYFIFTTLKQMKDFQSKMQSVFPTIPRNSF